MVNLILGIVLGIFIGVAFNVKIVSALEEAKIENNRHK